MHFSCLLHCTFLVCYTMQKEHPANPVFTACEKKVHFQVHPTTCQGFRRTWGSKSHSLAHHFYDGSELWCPVLMLRPKLKVRHLDLFRRRRRFAAGAALVLDRTPKAIAAADGVGYRVGFRAPEAANESAKKKCTFGNSAPTRRPADCFCTNAVKVHFSVV